MRKKNSKWPNFSACVSILGIAFGVISFLTVVTILDAFQAQIKSTILSVNPNITIFSPMGISDLTQNEKKIVSLEGSNFNKISPFIYQESILAYKKNSSAVYIRAIPGTKSSSALSLSNFIYPREILSALNSKSEFSPPKVILGKQLADNLGISVGENVTLMTFEAKKDQPPQVHYKKLEMVGTLAVGLSQYDKQYMLMSFSDAESIFGKPDWASGFEVNLHNPNKALQIANKLSEELPYSVIAWQEIDSGLFRQIKRDSTVIKFIVLIISIVGTFNILVTLGLTVIDRTKQIALLRSLGAQKKHIIGTFVCIGGILGLIGSLIGICLSVIILSLLSEIPLGDLNQFYYIDKIPVQFNPTLMVIVFFAATTLSCLGALYPAWRASKITPILGLK